jgi:hypothetical protein
MKLRSHLAVWTLALLIALTGACAREPRATSTWRSRGAPSSGSFVLRDTIFDMTATGIDEWTIPQLGELSHIGSPLSAGTSPIAMSTPDGSGLVFSVWTLYEAPPSVGTDPPESEPVGKLIARPSIKVLDLQSGATTTLADGAVSFAVSDSGEIAYVKGEIPDYYGSVPYVGTIELANMGGGSTRTIVSSPGAYRVAGWAGSDLLYYVSGEDENLDLYRVREGDPPQLVAESAAIIAISPDGTRVILQRLGVPEGEILLLDVESGKELAHIDKLTDADGSPLGALVGFGDWQGDEVIAAMAGDHLPGLVYLSVVESDIKVVGTVSWSLEELPWGLGSARFDEAADSVTAIGIIPPKDAGAPDAAYLTEVITCYSFGRNCTLDIPAPNTSGEPFPIFNPSR